MSHSNLMPAPAPVPSSSHSSRPKAKGTAGFAVAMAILGLSQFTACTASLEVVAEDGVYTESRSLASFSRVQLAGRVHVTLVEGGTYSARVTGDGEALADCRTDIHNGTLDIVSDAVYGPPVEVVVVTPYLNSLVHDGDGDVSIASGGHFDKLYLELNGSGNLHFNGDVDQLNAVVNGSGVLELEGDATSLKARVNSSGALYADALLADDIQATMAGSGDMTLAAARGAWMDIAVSGSGYVEWWGDPGTLKYRLSGSGKIIEHRGLLKAGAGAQPRAPRHRGA